MDLYIVWKELLKIYKPTYIYIHCTVVVYVVMVNLVTNKAPLSVTRVLFLPKEF